MNSFRLPLAFGGLALLAGGLSSCLKAPEYPVTPSISFNSIRVSRYTPANRGEQPQDTIAITINYQDGDGDLGLNDDEIKANPKKYTGVFASNYFIEPFVLNRTTRQYQPLTTYGVPAGANPYTAGTYNGVFSHPTSVTDSKAAPIKGTLTYTLIPLGLGDVFSPRDSVRFEVHIVDRALNLSNTITTKSVYIAPR